MNETKLQYLNTPSESQPFLIVNKPAGLPSAPLSENDFDNALCYAIKDFPEIKEINGRKQIEYGLIHRIDNVTNGLILIALNQNFYDFMIEEQKNNKFIKTYSAECSKYLKNDVILPGFPLFDLNISLKNDFSFDIESYFRFFGKNNREVRPVSLDSKNKFAAKKVGQQKKYKTSVLIKQVNSDSVSVECKISSGFRHQVRCHLAWAGLPIINDDLYNPDFRLSEQSSSNETVMSSPKIKFCASGLEFFNPVTQKIESFTL